MVHIRQNFARRVLSPVNFLIPGTLYFGGDRPGMLDYMIWPWVERLYLLRCVDEKKFDEKRNIFPNFVRMIK